MDKELLRIAIIATGLIIIVGMLVWGYLKSQRVDQESRALREIRKSMKSKQAAKIDNDDVDTAGDFKHVSDNFREALIEPQAVDMPRQASAQSTVAKESSQKPKSSQAQPDVALNDRYKTSSKQSLPRLIQMSIVATTEEGFNGVDLDAIFSIVGLEYGTSVKIYECLDIQRRVDYCVASMVNPGTFPDTDLESFYTPGITFFMQPQELPDPIIVFDDLLRTMKLLANELKGEIWDAEHKPLTDNAIKTIRKTLQAG